MRRVATNPFVVMPLVAVLVLGGWSIWRSRGSADSTAAATSSQLVAASTGTMSRTVSAQGTVAMAQSEDLTFDASGTVTAVNVVAGQAVAAGDVLATIDSAELEAAVADAETTLAEANAKLADDYTSGASYTQTTVDQAAVTTAQDRLDAAEEDLAGAQLVAPFPGTVATVDLTVGEELGSGGTGATTQTGSASGSGQSSGSLGSSTGATGSAQGAGATGSTGATTSSAAIQVVSAGSYTVELGLDDTDIAEVAVGQTATIALSTASSTASTFPGGFGDFEGFPGGAAARAQADGADAGTADGTDGTDDAAASTRTRPGAADVTGTVTDVGQVADASSGVATYPVTVAFSDTSGDFNAGATVQVDITYAEVTDAIQVPALAVTTTSGTSTVTVSIDGVEEQRSVTTGLSSGAMIEITSGLQVGEQVVVAMRGPGGQGGVGPGGQGPPDLSGAPAADGTTEVGTDG